MPSSNEKSIHTNLRSLAKHTSVYSIASLAQSAVSFLLLPLYVKFFTPDQYGLYSLLLMISSIGSAIFYLGVNSALPTSYFESDDPEIRRRVFSTALNLTAIGAAMFVLFTLFFGKFLSKYLFGETTEYWRIVMVSISGGCGIISQVLLTLLRILQKTKLVAISGLAGVTCTLLLTYFLVASANMGIDGPIMSSVVVQVALLACYLSATKNWISKSLDLHHSKILLKYGGPTVLISFGVMTIEWSDRIIIQKFMTTTDVGLYSIACRIGSIVTPLLITPIAQVWNPVAFEEKKHGRFSTFTGQIVSIYTGIALVLTVSALLLISDFFSQAFKANAYAAAAQYVPFIMAGSFLNGLNNFVSMGAVFERKLRRMVFNVYLLAAISIILNVTLIRYIGAWGAASTTLLVNLISPILSYRHASRFHPIKFETVKVAGMFGVSIATLALNYCIPWPSGYWVFLTKAILLIGFLCPMIYILRRGHSQNVTLAP
jgi:O-antigen/teichoic acid export membrane protein